MNRREFLKALSGIALPLVLPSTAAAVRLVAPEVFRLCGDGYTDDTAALQVLIDGKVVIGPDGRELQRRITPDGYVIVIPAGTYNVSNVGLGVWGGE